MKAVFLIGGSDIGSNVTELAELCPEERWRAGGNERRKSTGEFGAASS